MRIFLICDELFERVHDSLRKERIIFFFPFLITPWRTALFSKASSRDNKNTGTKYRLNVNELRLNNRYDRIVISSKYLAESPAFSRARLSLFIVVVEGPIHRESVLI